MEPLATLLSEDAFAPIPIEHEITFQRAQDTYIAPCKPVMFSGLASNWPAMTRPEWRSLRDFTNKYDCEVPVVESKASDAYGNEERTRMRASEWAASLECSGVGEPSGGQTTGRKSYLKDFHFALRFPNDDSYSVPPIFCDDWLNAFHDARTLSCTKAPDDYRFLYASNARCWTPLHIDVLKSHSWSANVEGWKLWLFWEEDEMGKFYGGRSNELMESDLTTERQRVAIEQTIEHIENQRGEVLQRPVTESAESSSRMYCLQGPGDIVFVPSGVHHQVFNLSSPTISINHNWFGGAAIKRVWDFIKGELEAVRKEIADVGMQGAEFEQHCQLLLRAQCGFDLDDFGKLLLLKLKQMRAEGEETGQAQMPQLVTEDEYRTVPLARLTFCDPHESHLKRLPKDIIAHSRDQLNIVISEFLIDPYVSRYHDDVAGRRDGGSDTSDDRQKALALNGLTAESAATLHDKLARLADLYNVPRLTEWKTRDFS